MRVRLLGSLVTALRTLTALPVAGREAERPASALPWFPAVGGFLGLVLYGLAEAHSLLPGDGWPAGGAVLVLLGGCLLTRGLHLDGLADWADGFGASRERERVLAVMKDPRVGAFGVIALVLVLAAKWAALTRIIDSGLSAWIVAALVVSRAAQVDLIVRLPYARAEGGTAGRFFEGARRAHGLAALAVGLLLALLACGPAGAGALLVGWLLARLLGDWFRRRVGGVTGDLLGAASEMVETTVLFLAAAGGGALAGFTGWGWTFAF